MELQLPISDLGHNPGLWGAGHSVITRVLKIARGRQESQSQRIEHGGRGCVMELIAGFKDGERAHESRSGFYQQEICPADVLMSVQ